jgi:hypothetical protein
VDRGIVRSPETKNTDQEPILRPLHLLLLGPIGPHDRYRRNNCVDLGPFK